MKYILYVLIFSVLWPSCTFASTPVFDIDTLIGALPSEAANILENNGLDQADNYLSPLSGDTLSEVINNTFSHVKNQTVKPLMQIFMLCLLTSCANILVDNGIQSSMSHAVNLVGVLVCLHRIILPVHSLTQKVIDALYNANTFLTSFVPAYSAAVMSAGQPMTASVYTSAAMLSSQVISLSWTKMLSLLFCIYLCLSVASCLCREKYFINAVISSKKLIMSILILIVIVFNGILSVQTFVSKPADTVALKAGKLIVSSAIPVVGSAVSDAFTTIYGSMSLAKNAVGVFGILGIILIFLPTLLSCLVFKLGIWCCKFISQMFDTVSISYSIEGIGCVLDLCIAVIACQICLHLISIIMLLSTGG